MKKATFITAIVVLSFWLLSYLMNKLYMATPVDSGIEAFSAVMSDFFIVLGLVGTTVLCALSIVQYFIKPKNDIPHNQQE